MDTQYLPFERLQVYKEALVFVDAVYQMVRSWPKDEIFGLSDQCRRAAVSIALNIAEGSSRSKKDFHHFLDISRGSCYECLAICDIARSRGFIEEKQYVHMYQKKYYDNKNVKWSSKITHLLNYDEQFFYEP